MTETEPQSEALQLDLLEALVQVESDPTGSDTFARFLWQTKQAVRQWLTCLKQHTGPLFVGCELVDDLVLVHADRFRFVQLKTRDRGSWSAREMCDGGVGALVRSYAATRNAGLHERSTFELWLEGPASDAKETREFMNDPTSAGQELRSKILGHGLDRAWLDDFLQRLVIRDKHPPSAYIDAQAMREIHAQWPALRARELEVVYERLLNAAAAAQAAAAMPATIQAHLAAARPFLGPDLPAPDEPGGTVIEPIRRQVLTRKMLAALTPGLPEDPAGHVLDRISDGSTASRLELKMTVAGAETQTIQQMQELRAQMEVQRQLLLASRDSAEADLERLAGRVLTMADNISRKIAMYAGSNPLFGTIPAEVIAAELLSHPSDLVQCDAVDGLFGDAELIYGFLGHLSDQCRFGWRAA